MQMTLSVRAYTKSWSLEHLPAAVVCALWVAGSATFFLVVSNTRACSTHTHSQYSIQLNLREKKARLAPHLGFYCRSAASKQRVLSPHGVKSEYNQLPSYNQHAPRQLLRSFCSFPHFIAGRCSSYVHVEDRLWGEPGQNSSNVIRLFLGFFCFLMTIKLRLKRDWAFQRISATLIFPHTGQVHWKQWPAVISGSVWKSCVLLPFFPSFL